MVRPTQPTHPPALEWERRLPADLAVTERVLQEMVESLRSAPPVYGDLDEVQLAVREALNNAIRHGSRLNSHKRIVVRCRCSRKDGLWIMVRDQGRGFRPEKLPDPTHPENLEKCGGRGIYIIRCLMDKVEFRDQGREIHMRRRRPPGAGEPPA